jgi:hypothetical protein
MNKIFFVLFLSFILISCTKENEEHSLLSGTYSGTFQRIYTDLPPEPISNVELTFQDDGRWTGISETIKYPALCNGNYTINDNIIRFENSCIWTADFDWTLILKGNFTITYEQPFIVLTKKYSDPLKDVYRLLKPIQPNP